MKTISIKRAAFTVAVITGLASTGWAAKSPHVEQMVKPISEPVKNTTEELFMLAAVLGLNCIGAFGLYKTFTGEKDPVA